ncbi:tape measure protein [Virgibacillus halodenitrificans]|uniref:Tape measure protein n=1 Tax=Virgibacillus halodenitrificans TaxID=1482 RepID=A0ABR7VWE6_VIRHA|nr:tape measure protein [Virgibacillus halodenitrificans]MBD1224794.1 tape measure protein [Virgibacillus halodenitrificans]
MAKNAIDIIVNADDRASKKIKGVGNPFENLHNKAKKAMGVIAGIGAVAGAGLGAVAYAGVQMNSTLEQSEARWSTLLKSSEKAEKQMGWMMKYAKQTPFDYQAIDETATALMGMGLGMEEVNKWLPALGDASAVLGGGSETVRGLGMALGQMNAKGKVSAEEMQQLAERGVNAWQMLADGMGMTQGEVRKLSEDGKLLAKDALPLIYEGMQKTFGGGTANLMKSTTGQAMLAKENFTWLAGSLTSGAFNWFGANILPLINSGLESLNNTFSGGILEGFQKLWSSSTKAKVVLLGIAGVINGYLISSLISLVATYGGAIVAFSGFLIAGMAVATLALTIIKYWQPIKTFFINTFGSLFSSFSNFFSGIWALVQPILSQVATFILSKVQQIKTFWNQNWGSIKQAFVNIWNFISGFISTTLNVILSIFNFIFPAIKFIVLSVWENIKGLIDGALKFIMGIVQVFAGLFTGNWSKLWEGIKNMFFGAIQFIWNYVQLFFGVKILGVIGKFAGKAVSFIKGFASKAGSAISSFASKVFSKITSMVSKVLSSIGKWVSNMVGKIDDLVYKFLGKVAKLSTDMALKMGKMWESLKGLAKKGVKMMVDAITGLGSTFLKAGKGLLSAFTDGVKKGIGKAVDAVKGGMKKIRDFLPFSPAKKGALSDLDKSGESFFPTWYNGALKKVPKMARVIGGAMGSLNKEIEQESGMVGLESFSGGRSHVTVTHRHEHSGSVSVNGDSGSETLEFTRDSIQETTETDILDDFRQQVRSR